MVIFRISIGLHHVNIVFIGSFEKPAYERNRVIDIKRVGPKIVKNELCTSKSILSLRRYISLTLAHFLFRQ